MNSKLSSIQQKHAYQQPRKRAAVVLLHNYSLQQFLWYYATCPAEYEWDALILPYDLTNSFASVLYNNASKVGIFNKISIYNTNRNTFSLFKKIKIFLPFLTSYITGRRVRQCEEIIADAMGPIRYDLSIVFSDYGVLSGAIISCVKNRNVLVFEDGIGDYAARTSRFAWKMFSVNEISGYFLAKMGYCNPAYKYVNRPTTQCLKYCSNPDWMKYRDYAAIYKLFDMEICDKQLYRELLNRAFLSDFDQSLLDCDIVLLGTVMTDFADNGNIYYQKIYDYLYEHHRNDRLLIKMHPRETYLPVWPELKHKIADNSVSADLLIPLLQDKKFISMFPSTALVTILANGCDCSVVHFTSLAKANANYENSFVKTCENIGWPADKIIQL